ncbi:hypothetical protein BCD64_01130 [Nostoc sp. MBR 210]|nr:hypothetical protein BCD64_01130 [Nostoc sp. MBR 210]
MCVIELKNINYTLPGGQSPLLKDVELIVNKGEFVVLRGPNARGKSTLVEIILGIREADNNDGEVKLFGYSPDSLEAKFRTGVVFQKELELPSWTQVGKFIDLIESHYPDSKSQVITLLQEIGIFDSDFTRKRTNNETRSPFSGSQERVLSLALALAGSPDLLIIDEPIPSSLTEANKRKCWQYVKTFWEDGGTVLLVYPVDEGDIINDFIREELRNNGIQPSKIFTLKKINDKDPDSPRTVILDEGAQILQENNEVFSVDSSLNSDQIEVGIKNTRLFHWIFLALKYAYINAEKLLAQPTRPALNFLFGIVFIIVLSLSFSELRKGDTALIPYSNFWLLANICSFYLAVVSTTSIGTNIALGRKEAQWTKFRQTLPVPPLIYILGEIIPYLLIWSLLAVLLAITSFICLHLPFSSVLAISVWLIAGLSLFLFLGLSIGYRLPLDALDLVALGLPLLFAIPLIIGAFLRLARIAGEISQNLVKLSIIADFITAYSPLYHWIQLVLASVQASEYDQHFWIHLAWLVWATSLCVLLAVKAYGHSCKLVMASIDRRQEV